jgi:hypothetical protein
MSKDLHCDAGMHVQVDERSGAGVPGIMDGDATDARRLAAHIPGAVEVARLHRRAPFGSENEIGFMPCLSRVFSSFLLKKSVPSERRDAYFWYRQ